MNKSRMFWPVILVCNRKTRPTPKYWICVKFGSGMHAFSMIIP